MPLCHGWTTFDSTYSFSQRFKLSFVNMGLAYYVLSPGGFSRFATYPGVFFFEFYGRPLHESARAILLFFYHAK